MTEPAAGEPPSGPGAGPQDPVRVTLRRAPRYRAFVVAGAVVGVVVGVLAALLLGDPGSLFSRGATTGYLAAIGLLLGALLGGVAAVLADRPRR